MTCGLFQRKLGCEVLMRKLTMTNKYSGVGMIAKRKLQIRRFLVGYLQYFFMICHSGPS